MKSNSTFIRIMIAVLAIIILFVIPYTCSIKEKYDQYKDLVSNLQSTNLKFEKIKINDSTVIAEQNQIILSEKEAKEAGILKISSLEKDLKNIQSQLRFESNFKTPDSIFVPYYINRPADTIGIPDFKFDFKYISPNGNWFSFAGNATNKGITLDYFETNHKYTITIADKKLGLFRKSDPIIRLFDENPYTDITHLQNVTIRIEKPFYKNNGFWYVAGFASGLGLAASFN